MITTTFKLDFDNRKNAPFGLMYWSVISSTLRQMSKGVPTQDADYDVLRSRGGKGWHVTVRVKTERRVTRYQIVALQLLCGSDPKRELYNLYRIICMNFRRISPFWKRRWNVLFRSMDAHS